MESALTAFILELTDEALFYGKLFLEDAAPILCIVLDAATFNLAERSGVFYDSFMVLAIAIEILCDEAA